MVSPALVRLRESWYTLLGLIKYAAFPHCCYLKSSKILSCGGNTLGCEWEFIQLCWEEILSVDKLKPLGWQERSSGACPAPAASPSAHSTAWGTSTAPLALHKHKASSHLTQEPLLCSHILPPRSLLKTRRPAASGLTAQPHHQATHSSLRVQHRTCWDNVVILLGSFTERYNSCKACGMARGWASQAEGAIPPPPVSSPVPKGRPHPAEPALLTAATGPSDRSIPMLFLFIHFYFNKQPVPLAPACLPPLRSPGLCENACAKRWRRGGAPGSPWHAPDVLCGQGAGSGGPERGPSLALQLPDLAAIQRDPAKCYFLNTLAFHNNLTTLLSFTSSLKENWTPSG